MPSLFCIKYAVQRSRQNTQASHYSILFYSSVIDMRQLCALCLVLQSHVTQNGAYDLIFGDNYLYQNWKSQLLLLYDAHSTRTGPNLEQTVSEIFLFSLFHVIDIDFYVTGSSFWYATNKSFPRDWGPSLGLFLLTSLFTLIDVTIGAVLIAPLLSVACVFLHEFYATLNI